MRADPRGLARRAGVPAGGRHAVAVRRRRRRRRRRPPTRAPARCPRASPGCAACGGARGCRSRCAPTRRAGRRCGPGSAAWRSSGARARSLVAGRRTVVSVRLSRARRAAVRQRAAPAPLAARRAARARPSTPPATSAGSRAAATGARMTRVRRRAALTLLLVLALAAPAGAAPSLVTLGSFTSPTWAGSPPGDTRRVFVTERVGRVRLILDGVVQATPFLDLTAITLATSQERGLLSVAFAPDYAMTGRFYVYLTAQSPAGRDPDPRVPPLRDQHERRRPGRAAAAADDPAQPGVEPQRRPAADRAGREAVAGDGRRRRRNNQFGHSQNPASLLGKLLRLDLGRRAAGDARRRPAQPVAVLVHAGRPDRDRRRRPEPVRGDQRRRRPQLRLAVPRGLPRLPVGPGLQRRRRRTTRSSRRPTAATGSARSPAATSCAIPACRRWSAGTSTATSATRPAVRRAAGGDRRRAGRRDRLAA